MSPRRWLLAAALVLVARILDVAVVARSPVAFLGADLTLLVVVAFALVEGESTGVAVGVVAGLVADLAPPVTGPLGLSAMGYGLAAVVAARWRRAAQRSALAPAGAAAIAALVLAVARLASAALTRGLVPTATTGDAVSRSVLTAALLALVVVRAVVALDRRVGDTEGAEVLRW